MILIGYLVALCSVTVLLESIPSLFVRDRISWWRASVICNIVTNPLLNVIALLLSAYLPNELFLQPTVLILEGVVVFSEAYFYQRMLDRVWSACLLYSLAANGISYGIGTVLLSL